MPSFSWPVFWQEDNKNRSRDRRTLPFKYIVHAQYPLVLFTCTIFPLFFKAHTFERQFGRHTHKGKEHADTHTRVPSPPLSPSPSARKKCLSRLSLSLFWGAGDMRQEIYTWRCHPFVSLSSQPPPPPPPGPGGGREGKWRKRGRRICSSLCPNNYGRLVTQTDRLKRRANLELRQRKPPHATGPELGTFDVFINFVTNKKFCLIFL